VYELQKTTKALVLVKYFFNNLNISR